MEQFNEQQYSGFCEAMTGLAHYDPATIQLLKQLHSPFRTKKQRKELLSSYFSGATPKYTPIPLHTEKGPVPVTEYSDDAKEILKSLTTFAGRAKFKGGRIL